MNARNLNNFEKGVLIFEIKMEKKEHFYQVKCWMWMVIFLLIMQTIETWTTSEEVNGENNKHYIFRNWNF